MIPVVWDMETGDPDDMLTLCFLDSHPDIDLKAVTVTPGAPDQIGLVKHVLGALLQKPHIPVGSRTPGYNKKCVSGWYYKWLGHVLPQEPDGLGADIMYEVFKNNPNAYLITGAPLCNAGAMFRKYPDVKIHTWVAQGGFAGDSVVPPEYRLEKFAGMDACPTFNFNGDPKSAELLLATENIGRRFLVSKNVCHGVLYDKEFHKKVEKHKRDSFGLGVLYSGMSQYLSKKSHKKFHDPLAACVAVDQSICEFRAVDMFRRKGKWGAELNENSNTQISINVDMDKFFNTLVTT